MQPEHHRAHRYPFVASVELTDVESETQLRARTSNLSLFGCRVDTISPFPAETKVRLRITHGSTSFVALGKVAHAQPNVGMGIIFTAIESNDQAVLEDWLGVVRGRFREN